ncbi:hypothetical protein Poli38472_000962 [Pythium oligandrum]|uniref:Uncharacterized protein n=1 Tax=Pythium oligandrum TaxID=41045 RepID=A0A8K1CDS1_PYTOL|nr:hypothetical protein Poli38472_000962 [Pythium oligandrum]|eukprot:TMW60920.1 hypothetical protein Poli38472_000962 [Pythium oligandrum]
MVASPSKAAMQRPESVAKITVYVATCQLPPGSDPNAVALSGAAFKATKFQAQVATNAKLSAVQYFLLNQWGIANSPYAKIPVQEQFYTFKGRILRLDTALDAYYISDNDTIYLRFSSLGKICDPWAMSTSELRTELKTRNAYVPKLQPEQLMLRLQEEIMKESRLQRLQRATKMEEEAQVLTITKELAEFQAKLRGDVVPGGRRKQSRVVAVGSGTAFTRPASLTWSHPPSINRTVFLSITQLDQMYQVIPRDVLEPAILIFDAERKWVFDKHNILQKNSFDYKYMCFDADFLEFLTLKEEMGLVYWFRPQKSYEKLSAFLTSIDDPVTQAKFSPLILKEVKWLTLCGLNGWEGKSRQDGRKRDLTKVPKFTRSIMRVTTNLQSQSFDYLAVQELLYQSNPTLLFVPL